MASQPSDRLKAIVAEARARSQAAAAAGKSGLDRTETHRVEALVDRTEALPDSRALSRFYRRRDLAEQLQEEVEEAAAVPPAVSAAAPASAADTAPAHPPLSPSQIREVMQDLRHQFTSGSYSTFEAKPLPEDVIPFDDNPEEEDVEDGVQATFYILGGILLLLVIGTFVYLAVSGALRYPAPSSSASPSPAVSPARR